MKLTNPILALAVAAVLAPVASATIIVSLDTGTTLLDASTFTADTTYYAAWQLVGSGGATNVVNLSAFTLNGGAGIDRQPGDPVDSSFTLGPNAASAAGVWQLAAALGLAVDPSDSFSLYSQLFVAGSSFSFAADYTNIQASGFPPDAFSFQLYDSSLSTLLYDVSLDLTPATEAVPEPSTLALGLLGVGLLAALRPLRKS